MNTITKKSPHPYHHVIIGKDQEHAILCVDNGDGYGSYDMWKVDRVGHERTHGITEGAFMNHYHIDMLPSEVLSNIYKVLDFYVKLDDNVEELKPKNNFAADDIPF